VISPAVCCPGEAGEPGGLGDGQLDGGDAGWARLPAAGRDGRVAEGYLQVSVANVAVGRDAAGLVIALVGCREAMLPVSVLRMAVARSWARADRAVCRQINPDWAKTSGSRASSIGSGWHLGHAGRK